MSTNINFTAHVFLKEIASFSEEVYMPKSIKHKRTTIYHSDSAYYPNAKR